MKRITVTVELNDEIRTNLFFPVPGAGAFEHKSFCMAKHLTSNVVPGAGILTNRDFKSSNAQGWPRGDVMVLY